MTETWPVLQTEQSSQASGSPVCLREQVIPTSSPGEEIYARSTPITPEFVDALLNMAGATA